MLVSNDDIVMARVRFPNKGSIRITGAPLYFYAKNNNEQGITNEACYRKYDLTNTSQQFPNDLRSNLRPQNKRVGIPVPTTKSNRF